MFITTSVSIPKSKVRDYREAASITAAQHCGEGFSFKAEENMTGVLSELHVGHMPTRMRIVRPLVAKDIRTIQQLTGMNEKQLVEVPGLGLVSIRVIRRSLAWGEPPQALAGEGGAVFGARVVSLALSAEAYKAVRARGVTTVRQFIDRQDVMTAVVGASRMDKAMAAHRATYGIRYDELGLM